MNNLITASPHAPLGDLRGAAASAGNALPRATLRLQLHKDFNFLQARRWVPYAASLGISHFYVSPILTARAGSRHGYDIVDHGAVNAELGGEEGLRALVGALRAHGMCLLVDIVPNHMAVGGADNRIWLDVLEWGPVSRYANFFDIDWDVPDPALNRRVLVPFLGKPYGEALADIELCFDAATGRFYARYFEHRLPLAPASYPLLLHSVDNEFAAHAARLRSALGDQRGARGSHFDAICNDFAQTVARDPALQRAVRNLLDTYNVRTVNSRTDNARTEIALARLHRLFERQHYRLAWWRTAADEINWRRFFDVIELAGIRVQEPAVFEIAHATIFRLYAEGLIDGVRIDHIDGLADPRTYCRRLRYRLGRLARQRPPSAPRGGPYILVEKILGANERLVRDWRVHGTTGYSFMNTVGALFHAPCAEQALTQLWETFSGRSGDFDNEEKTARRRVPQELLAADFSACAHALHNIARRDAATRDWSLAAIRRVLTEILVQFPVYRVYVDARGRSAADAEVMAQTVAAASPFCRSNERPLLALIDTWLGGEAPLKLTSNSARRARLRAIARFQQLSSPVAAKSVEDTAFYRHGRLLSRNEVGANPGQFSLGALDFYRECDARARNFPYALLATATHDHKRGEDLRMRLAVISEVVPEWAAAVATWSAQNSSFKTELKKSGAQLEMKIAPDLADEYMLYQMLVGAWPPLLALTDITGVRELCERIGAWQRKAVREAKRHSSWAQPNTDYEQACEDFLSAILDPQRAPNFLCNLHRFVQRIASAGAVNSLAQVALKSTTPGVPDFYQGCEYWDFSLVDPDNRRPVNFAARAATLAAMETACASDLLPHWRDGRIKQFIIQRLLLLRSAVPKLFTEGLFMPLPTVERNGPQFIAFMRRYRRHALLVIVPRFCAALVQSDSLMLVPSAELTMPVLPPDLPRGPWRNVLGDTQRATLPKDINALLENAPLAVWYTDGSNKNVLEH